MTDNYSKKIYFINSHDFCMLPFISKVIPGSNVEERIVVMKKKIKDFIIDQLKEECFSKTTWFDYVFPICNFSSRKNKEKNLRKDSNFKKSKENRLRNKMLIPLFMLPIILLALNFPPYQIYNIILPHKYKNKIDENYLQLKSNVELVWLFQNTTKFDNEKCDIFLENLAQAQIIRDLQEKIRELEEKNLYLEISIQSILKKQLGFFNKLSIDYKSFSVFQFQKRIFFLWIRIRGIFCFHFFLFIFFKKNPKIFYISFSIRND